MAAVLPIAPRRQQSGAALIMAMMVVAIATTAAVAITTRLAQDDRRTLNILLADQAWRYALAAEGFAELALREDAIQTETDDPASPLYAPLPPTPVENGVITGRIYDLGGCFNVNSITETAGLEQFEDLLDLLGVDRGYAQMVADWIDADADTRVFGAEDGSYIGRSPQPYRAANQALQSLTALNLINDGFSDGQQLQEQRERLFAAKPACPAAAQGNNQADAATGLAALLGGASEEVPIQQLCALPAGSPINVNMATPEVLASLHDDLDLAAATALSERACQNGPWENINDFFAEPEWQEIEDRPAGLTVHSEYFMALIDATAAAADIGSSRVLLYSLIHRDVSSRKTTVIARSRNIF